MSLSGHRLIHDAVYAWSESFPSDPGIGDLYLPLTDVKSGNGVCHIVDAVDATPTPKPESLHIDCGKISVDHIANLKIFLILSSTRLLDC